MNQYKFRLTTDKGAVYYTDSVASTLRVIDNTRAQRGGVRFVLCEYARVLGSVTGKFRPIDAEELRSHDIDAIHEIDERRSNTGCLIWIVVACAFITLAVLGMIFAPN